MFSFVLSDGRRVPLEDITVDDWILVEKASGVSYLVTMGNPLRALQGGVQLAIHLLRKAGEPVPDRFTPRVLDRMFEWDPAGHPNQEPEWTPEGLPVLPAPPSEATAEVPSVQAAG